LFYWRHKILAALKQVPTEAFQGIAEMEETYFLYSEKGRWNLTERSRVSAEVKLSAVVTAATKSVYWSPETVRR